MRRARISVAAVVAAVLAGALLGCTATPHPKPTTLSTSTPLPKVNQMTPDESIAFVKQFADAAGAVVGAMRVTAGTLTPEAEGYEGQDCTLPNGKPGWQYSLVWTGPGAADPKAAIAEIQSKWKELGEDLKIESSAEVTQDTSDTSLLLSDPPYNTGTHDDGYLLTLRVASNGTTIEAQTHCVPIPKKSADSDG